MASFTALYNSDGQSVRSEKNLSEISQKSVRLAVASRTAQSALYSFSNEAVRLAYIGFPMGII